MKTCDPALTALFASGAPFLMADLLTITPVSGSVIKLTNANRSISAFSRDLAFTRGDVTSTRGLETTDLEIVIHAAATDLWGGLPIIPLIRSGYLDGAKVLIQRAYTATDFTGTIYTLWLFSGNCAEVNITSTTATITARSPLQILDQPYPKHLYQPLCAASFMDEACGVLASPVAVTDVGSSTTTLIQTDDASALNTYRLGTITGVTGANAGLKRIIRTSASDGTITALTPFPTAPTASDTFHMQTGCDRVKATCIAVYDNASRFRGCPLIPLSTVMK